MAVTEVPTTDRPEVVVKLSSPIVTHEGPVNELKLKSPPGRAFLKFGSIHKEYTRGQGVDAEFHVDFHFPAVFHFAALASGVAEDQIVRDINALDVMPLAYAVNRVLSPTPPKTGKE